MSVTINGITVKEGWEGWRKGKDYKGGPTQAMQYILEDWTQVNSLIASILGYTSYVGGSAYRVQPHRCPSDTNLIALSAHVEEGVGENDLKDSGRATFYAAKVMVTYGIREFDPNPDPAAPEQSFPGGPYVAEQSIEGDVEIIINPAGSYKYSTAPQLPVPGGVSMSVGRETYLFEIKGYPYLPSEILRPFVNKINSVVTFGCPVKTLRLDKYSAKRVIQPNGKLGWDILLTFKYREYDWNKVPRRDTGAWDTVVQNGGTGSPYSTVDFGPLLALAI